MSARSVQVQQRWAGGVAAALVTVLAGVVALQLTHVPTACGGRNVELHIVSSTEKSTLLERLAGDYNKRGAVGDLCPLVSVVPLTSGTAEQALEKGWTAAPELTQDKPAPDVWTPTTSMWVTLTRGQEARPGGTTTTRRRPVPRRRPKPHCRGDAHGKSRCADPDDRRGQEEIRLGSPATLHGATQARPRTGRAEHRAAAWQAGVGSVLVP